MRLRSFQHASIRSKLVASSVITTTIALLLACVAFVAYDLFTFREALARKLSTQAEIVGLNSVSALLFNDSDSATSTLKALRAEPQILAGAIYAKDGSVFARYSQDGDTAGLRLPALPADRLDVHRFENGRLVLFRPIFSDKEPVGMVYLEADLAEMRTRIHQYAGIAALVLLVSLAAAMIFSFRLQRIISEPILHLAATARSVSADKNYSVRAAKERDDETGVLVEAFNDMLTQIQSRDSQLSESKERLDLALKSAGVGTWNWNLQIDSILWDEYTCALFAIRPEKAPARVDEVMLLVDQRDRALAERSLMEAVEGGDYVVEYRTTWSDGSQHVIASRGKVYRDPAGRPTGMTGVCWDVTERRRAEEEVHKLNTELEERVTERTAELEAANRELEAFSYSVSHDLRAPLRAIDGFSRILLGEYEANLPDDAKEYLGLVCQNTKHMGQLVDDLLAFSRLGRQAVKTERVCTRELVRECLRELRPDGDKRSVEIVIGDLPDCYAEPALLKQVWLNLLSNALKYTCRREAARIEITCSSNGDSGAPVYLVKDNGAGFDMRYANKLFGVFQRLHRAEDYAGTGVGLAIVRRIVERHGGRVWAEAAPDRGASFFFTLKGGPSA